MEEGKIKFLNTTASDHLGPGEGTSGELSPGSAFSVTPPLDGDLCLNVTVRTGSSPGFPIFWPVFEVVINQGGTEVVRDGGPIGAFAWNTTYSNLFDYNLGRDGAASVDVEELQGPYDVEWFNVDLDDSHC